MKMNYTPGQKEPEEYVKYFGNIQKNWMEAKPFSFPYIIVGFNDESLIDGVIKQKKIEGVIEEKKIFENRNPVLKVKYPSVFLSTEDESKLIKDANLLKSIGATDISGIGLSMNAINQLRKIFGKKSCPLLATKG